jgi:archaeal flagellar protein FlaJ
MLPERLREKQQMQNPDKNLSFFDRITDKESFSRSLRAARVGKTYDEYIRFIATQVAYIAIAMVGFIIIMQLLVIRFTVLKPFPVLVQYTIILAVPIALVFLGLYFQPVLVVQGRKAKIDMDLPYAITYMQALSSTLTLYNIFRSVYEQEELYGEVSREFGMIVRDVELFGDDLITAMRNLGSTTPSENLKTLLDDLILMFESGGDITAFLASRSAHYRDIASRELETGLKTLEIMAEVYVTAFVAAPIAVIIMMVAENMSGQSSLSSLMPFFLIGLPLGAGMMIWIISLVIPSEHYEITHREVREQEFEGSIPVQRPEVGQESAFVKSIQQKRKALKFLDILRHPMKYFISDFWFAAVISAITGTAVFLLFVNGVFNSFVPPRFQTEVLICFLIIAVLAPVMVSFEVRRHYINRIEAQVPDFLRELTDLKDIGLTIQGSVHLISASKLGVLSSELGIVDREVQWGSNVSSALVRMEERIGVVMIKRAISLIVRASEVTNYIREVLIIAVGDMEHYLKLKNERYTVSFAYIMIVYLSFAIYLYTAYQLNVSFISSFEKLQTHIDISGNTEDMFRIGIILGFFSGIMAGQLSAGSIYSGFKHAIVFLAATVAMFVYIL